MYLAQKYYYWVNFLKFPTGEGTATLFYVVIWATPRSSHLRSKAVPSFLSYLKTLSIDWPWELNRPTDKVSPAAVIVGFLKVKGGSKINFNSSY